MPNTEKTQAQILAEQVNTKYEGEAPAYAVRIAATEAGAQEQHRPKFPHLDNTTRAFVFDDGSEIVIDGPDWSVKNMGKEPEHPFTPTIYVVLDENTLGYIQTPNTRIMEVLHGSVLRGGYDWKNGGVLVDPKCHTLRPATKEDFTVYRVMPPANFQPVSMETLNTYRIMSPFKLEPNGAFRITFPS